MADADAELKEAKDALSTLLATAKDVRDNLSRNALKDELYWETNDLKVINSRIDSVKREIAWSKKRLGGG